MTTDTSTAPEALAVRPQAPLAHPEWLARFRQRLQEASSLPDLARLDREAETFRVLVRQAGLGREAQNDWAEYRLDAERKAGALLRRMAEAGERARPRDGVSLDRPPTLVDLGVAEQPEAARQRASRWQHLAAIPEDAYARWKASVRAGDTELTQAAALRLAEEYRDWSVRELGLRDRLRAGEIVIASFRTDAKLIAWAEAQALFVRVDRRSDWGNPFEMDEPDGPRDGDRETVIRNYAEHYLPFKPSLLRRLPQLRGRALGCWCAPEPCHGDVLKAQAEDGGRDREAP